jgi:integration host factor subunit alpha
MNTLTKAGLTESIVVGVGLNNREAREMVEHFFEEISLALEAGTSVKLSGFGVFNLRDKPERPGRNPKTGKAIPVKARRVVTFHASASLKDRVDSSPFPRGATEM